MYDQPAFDAGLFEDVIRGIGRGWKRDADKGKYRYKSPSGDRPRVKLSIRDARAREFRLEVRKLDLAPLSTREFRVELWTGGERIATMRTLDEVKPGKLRYRD